MKRTINRKKNTVNKPLVSLSLMLVSALLLSALTLSAFTLTAFPVFADTGDEGEHGRPLEDVLGEIREKQGLGPDETIDPRDVNDRDLEELGEAVMSIMHPEPEQHELMDQMMGGEGSESLRRAHIRMGYNYLASLDNGRYSWFGRRGWRGMM